MKIAIIDIIGLPYDGTTVYNQGLGGSESAVTFMAEELAAIGFAVTVFNNCYIDHASPGVYRGVTYRPLSELENDHNFDVVVSSRTIIPFVDPARYPELNDNRAMPLQSHDLYNRVVSKAKIRVLWMHDTFCLGDNMIEELAVANRITDIFTLSDFHLTYVANCHHGRRRNFEVLKPRLFMTRNGARRYGDPVDIKSKDRDLFVYNASVTKGMIPLVNEVWPRLKQVIPTARLKVIGGYYRFSSSSSPDQQEQDWRRMVADPKYSQLDIEFTGVIPQSDIAKILTQANFMIYPAAFPETFGISSLESLLYNTPLITCRFGALEETALEGACYHIDYAIEPNGLFPDIDSPRQIERFVETAVQAYRNTYLHQQKQYYCNLVHDIAGWDTVALQWKQHLYKKAGWYLSRDDYRRVSQINRRVHKVWNRRYSNPVEFEYAKTGTEQHIAVVSTFYNCSNYIAQFIHSVACQDYNNYTVYMVNDASTDNTSQVIQATLQQLPPDIARKFVYIENQENLGAVANQVSIFRGLDDPESIVMIIDGDDSLVNDNSIFNYYNSIYDGNTEFSYGSSWSMADNIPLISQPYPLHVRQQGTYRQHHFNWILPYTHLRTFKKKLIDRVSDNAFKNNSGEWYRAGGDGSVFYALIEQAKPDAVRVVTDIVYNYNDRNPLNDYKINGQEQNNNARAIVAQPTTKQNLYSVVVPTMWRAADQFVGFVAAMCENNLVGEIIVINNCQEKTPQNFPTHSKIRMLDYGRNIYVNPAWNLGVEASQYDRLCIVNDDVEFDLALLEKLLPLITPSAGVFGLCPGEKDFNQPPVTTGSIDIIPWQGHHTYGFGCMMFLHRDNWYPIPSELEIYYGDNYIFDKQLAAKKINYLITNLNFKSPMAATTRDTSITGGFLQKETPIYKTIMENTIQPARVLINEYQSACSQPSDINTHLPVLHELANQCQTVVELGVRTGVSTRALLNSDCENLYSYDLVLDSKVIQLFELARSLGKNYNYEQANSLTMTIPETDLLFIDTDHTYDQLSEELARHHLRVKKYMAFHDTFTYGLKTDQNPTRGIFTAIVDFMTEHPEWQFKYNSPENNGFTVIERRGSSVVQPAVQTNLPSVAATKKILIAIPTARNIEVETFKSIYDLEAPQGYTLQFQYFYGYNIDQVRNLIADWIVKGYDYLFSVDSDIAFPPDTLKKLLAHDRDMVSGLYIQRKPGQHILEIYEENNHGGVTNIPYEKIIGRGLVEIAGCGFGCVLVKAEVMRAIPYPHFKYYSAIDHANTVSEDVDFCRKAVSRGFKIYADTSVQCRHIGSTEFLIDNSIRPQNSQDRLRFLFENRLLPQPHVDYLQKLANQGFQPKVIYDVGACVLHWTNEARRIWPDAKYYLFEAMESCEFLYKEQNLEYHLGLLSHSDGLELDFYQNEENPGGNSYYRENPDVNPEAVLYFNESHIKKKLSRTLDSVVFENKFALPSLLKIDVQGAELDILRGAHRVLSSVTDVILELQVVEYNRGAPLRDSVIAYMNQLGFECLGLFCNNGPDGDYHFKRRMS